MTFTNTNDAGNNWYWYEVKAQLRGYLWNQVNRQVFEPLPDHLQVYGQINLIKYKIEQELNK